VPGWVFSKALYCGTFGIGKPVHGETLLGHACPALSGTLSLMGMTGSAHLEDVNVPGWVSTKALRCHAVGLRKLVHDVSLLLWHARQAAPLLGRAGKVCELCFHGLDLCLVVPSVVQQLC